MISKIKAMKMRSANHGATKRRDRRSKKMDTDEEVDDEPTSENYLPYSFDDIKAAAEQCGLTISYETDEIRINSLREIKNVLDEVSDLNYNSSDEFLLCFLRSRKFNVGTAAAAIKHYYHFLGVHRHLFDIVEPKFVTQFIKSNIIGFLPYRDGKGSAICYICAEAWDPDVFPVDNAICGGLVSLKGPLMANQLNQVAGIVAILNVQGFSLKQLYNITRYLLFFSRAMQKCAPCRVKKVHVINIPYVFSLTWKLVNPLISEKIRKRFIFHDTLDTLHDQVPQSILPEELGGYLGPFNNEEWVPDLQWMINQHLEDMKYSYTSERLYSEEDEDTQATLAVEELS